jgi:hypothetical protein
MQRLFTIDWPTRGHWDVQEVPANAKPEMHEAQVVGPSLHVAQGLRQVTHKPLLATVWDAHWVQTVELIQEMQLAGQGSQVLVETDPTVRHGVGKGGWCTGNCRSRGGYKFVVLSSSTWNIYESNAKEGRTQNACVTKGYRNGWRCLTNGW